MRARGAGRTWGTAVVLAILLSSSRPGAAAEPAETIARRGAKAPLVVVGEPLGQSSRWENGGIWTYTEVAVRDRRGEATGDTIVVRQRGGTVGRIGQRVSHLRLVDPSRPHLLLLWKDQETGLWTPGAEGVLPIERDSGGEERVEGISLVSVLRRLGVGR